MLLFGSPPPHARQRHQVFRAASAMCRNRTANAAATALARPSLGLASRRTRTLRCGPIGSNEQSDRSRATADIHHRHPFSTLPKVASVIQPAGDGSCYWVTTSPESGTPFARFPIRARARAFAGLHRRLGPRKFDRATNHLPGNRYQQLRARRALLANRAQHRAQTKIIKRRCTTCRFYPKRMLAPRNDFERSWKTTPLLDHQCTVRESRKTELRTLFAITSNIFFAVA